jgi:peptide/nickel transport system permease protein
LTFRFISLLGVVFAITVFCFLLVHLLPGDPTAAILGYANSPHNRAVLDRQLGLDKPLLQQYWIWFSNVLHGNLGTSQSGPTDAVVKASFRFDVELVIYSQVLAYLISVPMSVYAAKRARGKFDQAATLGSFLLYCLPAFILVIWLIDALTLHLHWFPGPGYDPFPTGLPFWSTVGHNLYGFLLPSIIIALGTVALFFRLLRTEMEFTLQEEYITVARSKGLSDRRILWRHALRPSMSTLLASTGNNIALLVTGLFIVEVKFALPGLGASLQAAIQQDNYVLVQGIALVTAVFVVFLNFLLDIATVVIDPRVARA